MASPRVLERDREAASGVDARRVFFVALALALVPFVVAIVAVMLDGNSAVIRDQALTEMRVRDIGHHPVLVGLYSRDGWSHPGPLIFYTLVVPYRLLGSGTVGLLVGGLLINAAAVVGMGVVARRLGGTPAALLILLGATVLARALGTDVLIDPWVCFVTVIPFGLFCLLAWAMAEREAWALPASAALASWLVQTHVGFAPLTAPVLAAGVLWLVIAARRDADPLATRRVSRAGLIAVAVLVLAWILPLWDQVFGSGNLGRIAEWFTRADDGVHSVTEGARIVFGQLAVVPDWITGTRRVNRYNGETALMTTTLWPVLLVPFVAAAAVAWRRRDRPVLWLTAVVGLMLVLAVVSVARTIGLMFEYRLLWTWVLGVLAGVVIAWTAWDVVAERWPWTQTKVLTPLALFGIGVLCVLQIADVSSVGTPDIYSTATEQVTDRVADQLDPDGGEVVLRAESNFGGWILQGLLVGLEKQGFDPRVAEDDAGVFGDHRVASGATPQARLLVLTDHEIVERPPSPELELVAYGGPVPMEQRLRQVRRNDAERRALIAAVEAGEITDDEFSAGLDALALPGEAVAVYREP